MHIWYTNIIDSSEKEGERNCKILWYSVAGQKSRLVNYGQITAINDYLNTWCVQYLVQKLLPQ